MDLRLRIRRIRNLVLLVATHLSTVINLNGPQIFPSVQSISCQPPSLTVSSSIFATLFSSWYPASNLFAGYRYKARNKDGARS
jgi:hypothetical protein